MTQIRIKRGTTVPLAGNLVAGELAINTATGIVYTKKDDNSVVAVSGGGAWGSITGTLSSQTDLNTALGLRLLKAGGTMSNNALVEFNDTTANSHLGINGNGVSIDNVALGLSSYLNKDKLEITDGTSTMKMNVSGLVFPDATTQTTAYTGSGFALLASPTFTGTPTMPTGTIATTQTAGNSTTALATTAFVTTADNLKANLASPTFTGDPKAPTPSTGDDDTSIATTAFVKAQNYVTSSSLTGYALLAGTSAFSVTGSTIRSLSSTDNFVQLSQTSLQFGNLSSGVSGLSVSGAGITFADSTVQTTAIVAGPAGTNGTNGINGANNYLDILTMTSSSASLYVSGGSWSAGYGFMNTSGGWFYNKLNSSGVTFKFYINGVFDSSVNAAYNYYSASTSYVTTPVSGNIMTVFISDGTAEATIPLITATY